MNRKIVNITNKGNVNLKINILFSLFNIHNLLEYINRKYKYFIFIQILFFISSNCNAQYYPCNLNNNYILSANNFNHKTLEVFFNNTNNRTSRDSLIEIIKLIEYCNQNHKKNIDSIEIKILNIKSDKDCIKEIVKIKNEITIKKEELTKLLNDAHQEMSNMGYKASCLLILRKDLINDNIDSLISISKSLIEPHLINQYLGANVTSSTLYKDFLLVYDSITSSINGLVKYTKVIDTISKPYYNSNVFVYLTEVMISPLSNRDFENKDTLAISDYSYYILTEFDESKIDSALTGVEEVIIRNIKEAYKISLDNVIKEKSEIENKRSIISKNYTKKIDILNNEIQYKLNQLKIYIDYIENINIKNAIGNITENNINLIDENKLLKIIEKDEKDLSLKLKEEEESEIFYKLCKISIISSPLDDLIKSSMVLFNRIKENYSKKTFYEEEASVVNYKLENYTKTQKKIIYREPEYVWGYCFPEKDNCFSLLLAVKFKYLTDTVIYNKDSSYFIFDKKLVPRKSYHVIFNIIYDIDTSSEEYNPMYIKTFPRIEKKFVRSCINNSIPVNISQYQNNFPKADSLDIVFLNYYVSSNVIEFKNINDSIILASSIDDDSLISEVDNENLYNQKDILKERFGDKLRLFARPNEVGYKNIDNFDYVIIEKKEYWEESDVESYEECRVELEEALRTFFKDRNIPIVNKKDIYNSKKALICEYSFEHLDRCYGLIIRFMTMDGTVIYQSLEPGRFFEKYIFSFEEPENDINPWILEVNYVLREMLNYKYRDNN